jgi:flagellar biosynthesis/type III secretory pathway chaperone
MATMKGRLRARGRDAAHRLGRVHARVRGGGSLEALQERVAELENEVQECRQLNLRLAELTDVVQELLVPLAQRDEARLADAVDRLEKYSRGI